jgi:hypothetical protein
MATVRKLSPSVFTDLHGTQDLHGLHGMDDSITIANVATDTEVAILVPHTNASVHNMVSGTNRCIIFFGLRPSIAVRKSM